MPWANALKRKTPDENIRGTTKNTFLTLASLERK
jgi:hypothetical protein